MSLKRSAVNVLVWLAALTAGLAFVVLAQSNSKNLAGVSNFDCAGCDRCAPEVFVVRAIADARIISAHRCNFCQQCFLRLNWAFQPVSISNTSDSGRILIHSGNVERQPAP